MLTPAARHAAIVSPEQSNAFGPAAAKTYGLPSCARAYATATAARDDGAGGFGFCGADVGGGDDGACGGATGTGPAPVRRGRARRRARDDHRPGCADRSRTVTASA